jgi:hypothetical protein
VAITNHERVGKAPELLKIGLGPFIERELKTSTSERRGEPFLKKNWGGGAASAPSPMSCRL